VFTIMPYEPRAAQSGGSRAALAFC
jgi:hypothetical protein